jgi:hypothetical protein
MVGSRFRLAQYRASRLVSGTPPLRARTGSLPTCEQSLPIHERSTPRALRRTPPCAICGSDGRPTRDACPPSRAGATAAQRGLLPACRCRLNTHPREPVEFHLAWALARGCPGGDGACSVRGERIRRRSLVDVEQWAEIRRMRFVAGLLIKEIALPAGRALPVRPLAAIAGDPGRLRPDARPRSAWPTPDCHNNAAVRGRRLGRRLR